MESQIAECNDDDLNLSTELFARGKVHVFIVFNLSHFIVEADDATFERLRGDKPLAEAFKKAKPKNYFDEDKDESRTVDLGYEFQVFRGHVKDDWLFPTFKLRADAPPPETPALEQEWKNFEFRVRLSRTGFLEVKLTRSIPKVQGSEKEKMVGVLSDLMEMGSRKGIDEISRSIQSELAFYCADLFISALPNEIRVTEGGKDEVQTLIHFTPVPKPKTLPYRQRYTILFLHDLICNKCGGRIGARKLWDKYKKTLAAILEGALIQSASENLEFPILDDENVKFEDMATWEDELCIFAPERCLIYFPRKNIFLSEGPSGEVVKYEDYWRCIVRGIEHTIAVRAALQIMEWFTTRDLGEIPLLTQKIVDGDISDKDKEQISKMAQVVSNTFNMLPALRNVLVPTSAFRASYAVNKFTRLNTALHLKDIQAHTQRNIDELVVFLQYFSNMSLQQKLQENESAINQVGIVIGLIALLVAAPSFLQDFNEFFIKVYHWPRWTSGLSFLLIGIVALLLIAYLWKPSAVKRAWNSLRHGFLGSNSRTESKRPAKDKGS